MHHFPFLWPLFAFISTSFVYVVQASAELLKIPEEESQV